MQGPPRDPPRPNAAGPESGAVRATAPEATARRNLAAVSGASFLTDVSSEMVFPFLPLYLATGLGLPAGIIGFVEGLAESIASLVKLASGRLSDRLARRKGLAVGGYALSTLAKPFLLVSGSWLGIATVRWVDRVGKGIRTAPRDALLADSVAPARRGWAFGLHRAADTAGAAVGLTLGLGVVLLEGGGAALPTTTFHRLVLVSLAPAALAVLVLALGAVEVPSKPAKAGAPPMPLGLRGLGRDFGGFLLAIAVFEVGNSSDAFLVLRASERGFSVPGVFAILLVANLAYAATSALAGPIADRRGKVRVLAAGWCLHAAVYLGIALTAGRTSTALLIVVYGVHHGLTVGVAKAIVADLVPRELRGSAYGALAFTIGILALPASAIAGVLWQTIGPATPFFFGAATAICALGALGAWQRGRAVRTGGPGRWPAPPAG